MNDMGYPTASTSTYAPFPSVILNMPLKANSYMVLRRMCDALLLTNNYNKSCDTRH